MKTILITAIGGDIAQAIATIVREEFPEFRILGTDIHDRHAGDLLADRTFIAPPAAAEGYGAWLRRFVREQAVDLCIPMSEAELRYFAVAGEKSAEGARLIMPNKEAIDVGGDKLATARHLVAAGCPAPWTVIASEPDAAPGFPCIFKPRRGAGSKGVVICRSAEEARRLVEQTPDAILQELLLPEDREVTCGIYRTRDGRLAVAQLLRKLVGGLTGWAKVIEDSEVRAQCESLAESLALRGSINAQLRITDRGPRIFEINARFSSTVLMRHRVGYQDVVWALKESLGEQVGLGEPRVGTTVVRTQDAAILRSDVTAEPSCK